MKTVTYYSDTSGLDDPSVYSAAYASMPEYRRRKIDNFVFPKDKKLSMGVELLLRKALEDLDENPKDIILIKNNKPALRGSDIQFNLSHSERKVMCSVSDEDVGCDVEKVVPINLDIARRYFFRSEYDAISSVDEKERFDLFYRYWTLKESFMKATGLGFELPLDAFEIHLGDAITVSQEVDGREYHFKEYSVDDGYRYACCSPNVDFEDMMRYVPFVKP